MKLVVDGLIFQKDPYGGIARMFREVLPRMCQEAPDFSVTLLIDGPVRSELPTHQQIVLHRTPAVRLSLRQYRTSSRLVYAARRLAGRLWNITRQIWLVDEREAIWHSTYYTRPVIWSGPQVVSVYDMIHERFPQEFHSRYDELGRQQKRRCLATASAVICVSESTRAELLHFNPINPALLSVVHLASAAAFRTLPDDLRHSPGIPEHPYILFVGARHFYKNFFGLLDFYRNWDDRANLDLLTVGPPWTKEEEQALKRLGLEVRVRLLSAVDDTTLCQLYNRAQAFVFPSLAEGFGIPLLEAMACGCPIIASAIPSTLEVATDCPYYFDLSEPASWISAFEAALSSGRDAPRVQMGLQRAGLFSWEKTAREMLDVYRKVTSDLHRSDSC
jgi:glycosyltransferase involved in cell wall biosynthesis